MPEVGEFNKFKSHNGNVFYGHSLLLYKNIVSMDIRLGLSLEDQPFFDNLLFLKQAAGETISYVSSFDDMFNPNRVIKQYETGEDISSSIVLDDDQAKAAQVYLKAKSDYNAILVAVKDKIKQNLSRPTLPYTLTASVDMKLLFGVYEEDAKRWINDPTFRLPLGPYRIANNSSHKANLLRVMANGKSIENMLGHSLKMASAKLLWGKARKVWSGGKLTYSESVYGSNRIRIEETYVSVGCQSLPRSEVERMATLQGWE